VLVKKKDGAVRKNKRKQDKTRENKKKIREIPEPLSGEEGIMQKGRKYGK